MSDYLTVSEAARELEQDLGIVVRPRTISDLFYQRQISEDLGPIVGGRRLITREALPAIRELVRKQAGTGVPSAKYEKPGQLRLDLNPNNPDSYEKSTESWDA